MLVNGANPDTGPLPAPAPRPRERWSLIGNGGADTLDVTGVAAQRHLGTITLDGGDGDDSLAGVYIAGDATRS